MSRTPSPLVSLMASPTPAEQPTSRAAADEHDVIWRCQKWAVSRSPKARWTDPPNVHWS
jgi:hypothetical protein